MGGHTLCPVCDGLGRRKRRRGEPHEDEYTGEPIHTQEDTGPAPVMSLAELDLAIARIERTTAAREGRILHGDELPWLKKKDAMRRHGDYDDLGWALLWLRRRRKVLFFHVWQGLVLGWDVPHPQHKQHLRAAIDEIAARMPDTIRVPSWIEPPDLALKHTMKHGRTQRHQELRGERNRKIREAIQAGRSKTAIAFEYGLSRRMVQHIGRDIRAA